MDGYGGGSWCFSLMVLVSSLFAMLIVVWDVVLLGYPACQALYRLQTY
jgi:hypothetical protein